MKFPIRYRVYLPVAILLAAAACVLRLIACLTTRTAQGYFTASVLPEVSVWLLLALSLFALTYPLFNRDISVRPVLLEHPANIFPTGLLAFVQVVFSVDLLTRFFAPPIARQTPLLRPLMLLTALCGLCAAAYYVCCMFIKRDTSELRAWFGLAAALFGGLYAVLLYFDHTLPLNADCKITSQVTYLAMSLYMLFDVRMSLGRPKYAWQISFGLITAALTAYASLPSLITYLVQGDIMDYDLYETIYTFVFLLFLCARLYALSHLPSVRTCPIAEEAMAAYDRRHAPAADAVNNPINDKDALLCDECIADEQTPPADTTAQDAAPYEDIPLTSPEEIVDAPSVDVKETL